MDRFALTDRIYNKVVEYMKTNSLSPEQFSVMTRLHHNTILSLLRKERLPRWVTLWKIEKFFEGME